jgi:hypothetical protein
LRLNLHRVLFPSAGVLDFPYILQIKLKTEELQTITYQS